MQDYKVTLSVYHWAHYRRFLEKRRESFGQKLPTHSPPFWKRLVWVGSPTSSLFGVSFIGYSMSKTCFWNLFCQCYFVQTFRVINVHKRLTKQSTLQSQVFRGIVFALREFSLNSIQWKNIIWGIHKRRGLRGPKTEGYFHQSGVWC